MVSKVFAETGVCKKSVTNRPTGLAGERGGGGHDDGVIMTSSSARMDGVEVHG